MWGQPRRKSTKLTFKYPVLGVKVKALLGGQIRNGIKEYFESQMLKEVHMKVFNRTSTLISENVPKSPTNHRLIAQGGTYDNV